MQYESPRFRLLRLPVTRFMLEVAVTNVDKVVVVLH